MTKNFNEPILSVTKDDCDWIAQRGRGKGGQKKNKTSSAIICRHLLSGAQGYAEDSRSQLENRQLAFRRMAESKEFQVWIKNETLKELGTLDLIDAKVEDLMRPCNLIVEVKENDRWVVASLNLDKEDESDKE